MLDCFFFPVIFYFCGQAISRFGHNSTAFSCTNYALHVPEQKMTIVKDFSYENSCKNGLDKKKKAHSVILRTTTYISFSLGS